jgi:hypothetical protein
MAKKYDSEVTPVEGVKADDVATETKKVETREERIARSKMDAAPEDGGYNGTVGNLVSFGRVGETGDYKINIEVAGHIVSGFFNPITEKFKGAVYHTA